MNISYAGNNWGGANDTCDFVERGTMSIAWNGDVSPCWPLMHTQITYLNGWQRLVKKHGIGKVRERSLEDLWLDPGYIAYRERLHNFVFAPCTFCGGCELVESNEEDCLGNDQFPVCGACCGHRALSSARKPRSVSHGAKTELTKHQCQTSGENLQ